LVKPITIDREKSEAETMSMVDTLYLTTTLQPKEALKEVFNFSRIDVDIILPQGDRREPIPYAQLLGFTVDAWRVSPQMRNFQKDTYGFCPNIAIVL
jgi:hypothetical protein